MSQWFDLLGALFILMGAALALAAGVALIRFPDLLSKMHAITKPQVLGLLCVATGVFLATRTWWSFAVCTLVVALQLVTAPVSATIVSRAAFRLGLVDRSILLVDDLSDDLRSAGYESFDAGERKADASGPGHD